MNSKKQKSVKNLPNLTEEEKNTADTMIISDGVYDLILSQLQIDHDDLLYKQLVLSSLKRRTKDSIVFSIWKHVDSQQMAHLRDFIAESSTTAPFMGLDDVLISFALLYPALMQKIYSDLTDFFKGYIANFNRIVKTSF